MSMADVAKPQHFQLSDRAASSRFRRIVELIKAWQRRRSERETLRRLSDHQLRDIGLTRSMVMMESAKPFWLK